MEGDIVLVDVTKRVIVVHVRDADDLLLAADILGLCSESAGIGARSRVTKGTPLRHRKKLMR